MVVVHGWMENLCPKSLLAAITEDLSAHVHCQANTVAHRLAWFGPNIDSHLDWIDQPPSFIIDLLVEDIL